MKIAGHFNPTNSEIDAGNYRNLSKEEQAQLSTLRRRIFNAGSHHLLKRRQRDLFCDDDSKKIIAIQKKLTELASALGKIKATPLSFNFKLSQLEKNSLKSRIDRLLIENKRAAGRPSILEGAEDIAFVLLSNIKKSESRRFTDAIGSMIASLKLDFDSRFGPGSFDSLNFPALRLENSDDLWERSAKESLKKAAWSYVFQGQKIKDKNKAEKYFKQMLDRGGYTEYEIDVERECVATALESTLG